MPVRTLLSFASANLVLAGVLLMLGGDFMFALNDAMGKWLVASFSVGQVVLIRSVGAFIVLGPMIARQGVGQAVRHRAAVAAVLARGVRDRRHRAVLRRRRLSAAGRRHDLLHGRPDLRRGAVASAAWREGRLAALAGDPDRLRRRRHRAAPLDRIAVAVVAVRAGRQRVVRHDADPQPAAARHQRCRPGDLADAGRAGRRCGAQRHHVAHAIGARLSRRCCCWAWCRAARI